MYWSVLFWVLGALHLTVATLCLVVEYQTRHRRGSHVYPSRGPYALAFSSYLLTLLFASKLFAALTHNQVEMGLLYSILHFTALILWHSVASDRVNYANRVLYYFATVFALFNASLFVYFFGNIPA